MRIAICSFLMLAGLTLVPAPVSAQQSPLAESDKAVVMFDIQLDRVRDSELGKMLDLESKMSQLPGQSDSSPDPSTLERVTGAISAPESADDLKDMDEGKALPMEMFMKMEFKDSASAEAAMAELKEKADEVEIGGEMFYKRNDGKGPQNLLAHMVDSTTLEMGTEKYLMRADRNVMTGGLENAWSLVPDECIRIAIDLEGAKALVDQAITDGRDQVPENFAAYVDLIKNMKDLRLTLGVDSDHLLTIASTGTDESAAEELGEGLDSLLMFPKMMGQSQVGQLKEADPEAAAVAGLILDALKTEVVGDQMQIQLPRPDGFNEAVKRLAPPSN